MHDRSPPVSFGGALKTLFRGGAGRPAAPFKVEDYFETPLVDLGASEPAFAGILTPEPELGTEKLGVSDQFLANGVEYHRKYSNAAQFRDIFKKVFRRVPQPEGAGLAILDIGTGPGVNSIQPCLELFPDCRIVATDLSPQLLAILRDYVRQAGLQDRVATVCTDAMRNYFRPGAFDVVVGTAILHHLFDPAEAIKAARRALKPGGLAMFSEPFEGYVLLRAMFETILARSERENLPLPEHVATAMRTFANDFRLRRGRDKSDPVFQVLDDKWLFTRNYLEQVRKQAGFSSLEIVPVHDPHDQLFRALTLTLLRLCNGTTEDDIPQWAFEHIDLYDECISKDLKQDLALEGMIVLRA